MRVSRLRGMLVAVIAVVVILVVQALVALAAVLVADRGAEDAAEDTYSYVGDLMTERVRLTLDSASDVVQGLASEVGRHPDMDRDDLVRAVTDRLLREGDVGSMLLGWPSGAATQIAVEDGGYVIHEITPIDGRPGEASLSSTHVNPDLDVLTSEHTSGSYDIEGRAWYLAAVGADGLVWSEPYISVSSDAVVVSPVQPLYYDDGELAVVVGATLDLRELGALLDDIPIGEDAAAFILTDDRQVVAAPRGSLDAIRDLVHSRGDVPGAGELGLPTAPPRPDPSGGDVFTIDDDVVILERSLDYATGLDWILHLETSPESLAPGLTRFHGATITIAIISMLLVAIAAVFVWRMWHPVRTMRQRASTDALTGLANRYEFARRLDAIVESAASTGDPVMAIALDLDNFKELNDAHGHDAGDVVLAAVGGALAGAVRSRDVAARLGGDEFAAVMRIAERGDPAEVARRVRDDVSAAIHGSMRAARTVDVTAGFATTHECGYDADLLSSAADEALVGGKRTGKGATYAFGTGSVAARAGAASDAPEPAGTLPGDRR